MKNIAKSTLLAFLVALFSTLISVSATAAEETKLSDQIEMEEIDVNEIEINHSDAVLKDTLRPHPDHDVVDTALVFNNALSAPTIVHCVAYSANGNPLGRGRVKIEGRGLKFMRASDLANGRDYIGSVRCKARGKVLPSAFIVGAVLTDTKAKAKFDWPGTRIIFPAVATY